MQTSNKYRITTNGEYYRIEVLRNCLYPPYENKWFPSSNEFYDDIHEAKHEMIELQKEYKRQYLDKWNPI